MLLCTLQIKIVQLVDFALVVGKNFKAVCFYCSVQFVLINFHHCSGEFGTTFFVAETEKSDMKQHNGRLADAKKHLPIKNVKFKIEARFRKQTFIILINTLEFAHSKRTGYFFATFST